MLGSNTVDRAWNKQNLDNVDELPSQKSGLLSSGNHSVENERTFAR
jgi:hypothetical protein